MTATEVSAPVRLAELLGRSRYEVIPLDGTEERVLAHAPRDLKVTITVSPTRGLEPTLDLAARLAGHGFDVVPHLAARFVRDRMHLGELAARLTEIGICDVFVVAGDAKEPAGTFEGAPPLLDALSELGHAFEEIGIAGYPEGHPFVDDETLMAALLAKAYQATYIVSQVCFDPAVTARWIESIRALGVPLSIYVGVPGVVSRRKLFHVSTRIGIGDSLRFLRKNGSFAARFLRGGFSPDPLIDGLGSVLDREQVAGFHVFTFNDVEDTEAWRRERLNRLASPLPATD
jgi:methylenetetrahydrofolate reductase (NADPH)